MIYRKQKWLEKISLFILSTAIGLAICESIGRKFFDPETAQITFKGDLVAGQKSQFSLSDDSILLYELKYLPQKSVQDKQRNTLRVIVLGDSTTYSIMWTLNDYYPKLLEDLLNANSAPLKYEVINAGVPGYNTIQEARYLEKRWIPYSPNLVIIGYCAGNDRTIKRKIVKYKDGLYCSDINESYPYILELPFNLSKFLLSKSALYRLINLTLVNISDKQGLDFINSKIKYFNLTLETQKAIKKIKDISCREKFGLLFVIFPRLGNGPQYECDWIVNKCKEYGIEYIDLHDVFQKNGYEKIGISSNDDCHPNKLGHQLVAEAIFEYLKKRNFDNVN